VKLAGPCCHSILNIGGDNKEKSVDLYRFGFGICSDGLLATNVENTQKIDISEISSAFKCFLCFRESHNSISPSDSDVSRSATVGYSAHLYIISGNEIATYGYDGKYSVNISWLSLSYVSLALRPFSVHSVLTSRQQVGIIQLLKYILFFMRSSTLKPMRQLWLNLESCLSQFKSADLATESISDWPRQQGRYPRRYHMYMSRQAQIFAEQ